MALSVPCFAGDRIVYDGNSLTAPGIGRWFAVAGGWQAQLIAANPPPPNVARPGKTVSSGNVCIPVGGSIPSIARGFSRGYAPEQIEHGFSGSSVLAHPAGSIIPYDPDFVFFETGANDELRSPGPSGDGSISVVAYTNAINTYIQTLTAYKPSIRICIISCFCLTESYDLVSGVPVWHKQSDYFLATLKSICAQYPNVVCADVNTPMLAWQAANHAPYAGIDNVYLTLDGVHPTTPAGYLKYTEFIRPYVTLT